MVGYWRLAEDKLVGKAEVGVLFAALFVLGD